MITNAIIYFNSAILSQLLTSFEYQKDEEKIQIVKQASPVAWYNINLKGTYNFQRSEKLPDLDELMSSIEGYIPVQEKYPPPSGNVDGEGDLDVYVPLRGKNSSTPAWCASLSATDSGPPDSAIEGLWRGPIKDWTTRHSMRCIS